MRRGSTDGGRGTGAEGRRRHRFSTITFPSCGASKLHGATDIAVPRSVRAASICRANYGIISRRGLFRNTRVPVKSNNSRDSLSVYPGLMRNFPNSNAAFLITVPRSRAYTANNRALRQFSGRCTGAILPQDYRAVNP